MSNRLLLRTLAEPASIVRLSTADWNAWLNAARAGGLLSRCRWRFEAAGRMNDVPEVVRAKLDASGAWAASHARSIRWEMNRLSRALAGVDSPVVLLKGAAYLAAELVVSRGRLLSDVDILVPKDRLGAIEAALRAGGWEMLGSNDYDDHYYRAWMHELPPMRHARRKSVLDVHHNVLPLTGRLHPDANKLLADAQPLANCPGMSILAPADMTLHCAVHAFQDGDLASGIRDLLDVDGLLSEFGHGSTGFWENLASRGNELGLSRPLYYATRYAKRFLGTAVPDSFVAAISEKAPNRVVLQLMDSLVGRALAVTNAPTSSATSAARLSLYIRSHWLRMPPALLARHLTHKAWRSVVKRHRESETNTETAKEGGFAAPAAESL